MNKFFILSFLCLGLALPAQAKLKVGDSFPLAQLSKLGPLTSQKKPKISFKNKIVIVDFWASWCGPCKMALPAYDKLYKKYVKKGVVVIGVNVDDEANDGRKFLKDHGVSFGIIYDKDKTLVSQAGVETMPTSFLIDKKGRIQKVHQGFRTGDDMELEGLIHKLLK